MTIPLRATPHKMMPVHKKRLQAMKLRIKRIQNFMKHGRWSKIYHTGLLPAATFGCELHSMPPQFGVVLRHNALLAARLVIPGCNNNWVWAILGWKMDPWLKVCMAPLLRLHREIWLEAGPEPPQDVVDSGTMRRAIALSCCTKPGTSYKTMAKDPISAAHWALQPLQ